MAHFLEDQFTSADDAPITSPRDCEPGPGQITATQTAGTMFISDPGSGNVLNFTSPAGWGTQGLRFEPEGGGTFERIAGLQFRFDFVLQGNNSGNRCYFAWNDETGVSFDQIDEVGILMNHDGSSGTVQLMDKAGASDVIGTWPTSTDLKAVLIARSSGFYFYIHDGTNYNLTLITGSGSTSAIYGTFGNNSQVGSIDNALVPERLWTPAPEVGSGFPSPNSPYLTRSANNPITPVSSNPNETVDQYVPAVFLSPDGYEYAFVKGVQDTYLWRSNDHWATKALLNSGNPVIADQIESVVLHDAANDTVHIWTKNIASPFDINHYTCPDTDPLDITADAGNPIQTAAQTATDLSLGTLLDHHISCVLKIGSTITYYGYASVNATGRYFIWRGTGTSFSDITAIAEIFDEDDFSAAGIGTPKVFRWNGTGDYKMFFSSGSAQSNGYRQLRVATSSDGSTWTAQPNTILVPDNGDATDDGGVYGLGGFLMESADPWDAPEPTADGDYHFFYSGFNGELSPNDRYQSHLAHVHDHSTTGAAVESNWPVLTLPTSDGLGDPDSPGGGGVTYTQTNGTWEIGADDTLRTWGPDPGGVGWLYTYEGVSDGAWEFEIEFDAAIGSAHVAGKIIRYVDASNYIKIQVSASGGFALVQVSGGTPTTLDSSTPTIVVGTTYRVFVRAIGTEIVATFEDNPLNGVIRGTSSVGQTETTHGFWSDDVRVRFNRGAHYDAVISEIPIESEAEAMTWKLHANPSPGTVWSLSP